MSEIIDLANGLKLAYMYIPYVHSVSMGAFIRVGSREETDANNGIAHFIEHLNFKGTKRRSAFSIVKEMDSLGANINAYTSKEVTAYYYQCIDDTVEECTDILADLLINSNFPLEEVERERGVVLEEISMVNDTPDDLSQELCSEAFWRGHPLGRPILGSVDNIKRFSREDIMNYAANAYVSGNIVISVAGNITKERAISLCEKYFVFPSGKFSSTPAVFQQAEGPVLKTSVKDIEQANLTLAFPSFRFASKHDAAVNVFNCALGGGMSSILFQRVREQLGLAYSIYSYPSAYEDTGTLSIYLGTNPSTLEKAIREVSAIVSEIKTNGIGEEAFMRAKQQVRGAFVLGQESSLSLMRAIGKYAISGGRSFNIEEKIKELSSLKYDDVMQVADYVFSKDSVGIGYVGKAAAFDIKEAFAVGK